LTAGIAVGSIGGAAVIGIGAFLATRKRSAAPFIVAGDAGTANAARAPVVEGVYRADDSTTEKGGPLSFSSASLTRRMPSRTGGARF
jgi:type IV secretory pathway TrbL component